MKEYQWLSAVQQMKVGFDFLLFNPFLHLFTAGKERLLRIVTLCANS
jgi:hypothetical protein